jgi:hypothetical protein
MKGLLITLLIALGLIYSGPVRAATTLSDTELAGISGGGIEPPLHEGQSLPQEQQQPGSNYANYTPPREVQSSDGMDLAPELFAVLQSIIDAKRERKVLLHGATQEGALAFNLENVLSSDVISANNVFNGSSLSLDDETTEIEVNQLNSLDQLHRAQGNLHSSIAGHGYEKTVKSRSGSESYDYHVYSNIYRERRSLRQRSDTRINQVEVGEDDHFTSLKKMEEGKLINELQRIALETLGFKVDSLHLGAGVDFDGNGTVTADPGRFLLNADANIDVCIIFWCWTVKIDLVTIDETLNVVEPVVTEPGDTSETVGSHDNNTIEIYDAVDVAESSFSESYEHTVFTGGQMTGAEAELLALSEGTLSVENNSNVSLADGAQRNMRVFNGVNAVSSIAANALNVSRLPSFTAGPSAVSRISMQQHNRFNQQR